MMAEQATQALETRLLQVENLQTRFATPHGLVRAVDGVSLQLNRGETLGVVGESGSGKSILARSLMGLLPPAPYSQRSGRILLSGRDIAALDEAQLSTVRGREIAMIFQDPMTSLNPVLTIGQQIIQVLRRHTDLGERAARERAVELLQQVRIPAPERRVHDHPHHLSGGMRQRAVIAIALACGPRLLIADEPTTALDVTVQAQILQLLRSLQEVHHMALVLISHNLGVVAQMCDRVAVMYAGRIVEEAPTADLFAAPRMRYTEALMKSMPRLDAPSHALLYVIGGRPPNLAQPVPGCGFAPRCRDTVASCASMSPAESMAGERHRFACWNPLQGVNDGR
ncbi:ABC transporter ATP-binding protein [Verminephrobacter eiseniae]|uniref:Oligopeptide/dipeptide ABC transporter, ATPase subunit n=1 Tax=Verminephrobacter eiseniae (strain EF01-2) TaxID=391735 RepID=A1WPK1_VEREI|nr:ABC transporter ATP-binding protein [Verminephrobacter eiseniae]ABM59558.1 oligopeptide/dipeptide ABC transporter, ATPase subunit [Verminephrobacter eiseniae EF01-2]MCW5231014.1 ABC transporter ATP-binding protein [Verminephrobacter eiseniae]MCW5259300.1 ABC transporter ATP-binding protein [Verminephrobacter eiseniae]MCW5285078.1 ABC transporter ATP-binding protein [Verminephrobacter eiseniae]MCW5292747.1 ABC transporter ATP-binding protein [Verminephrobacter eiseniae]